MILTADRLGFKAYYTDIAAKVLDTYNAPDVIISAFFENEANVIALKFTTHDFLKNWKNNIIIGK